MGAALCWGQVLNSGLQCGFAPAAPALPQQVT